MNCLPCLTYLTPAGLVLDVIGFVLIAKFGHSLFFMVGFGPPHPDQGQEGDIYAESSTPVNLDTQIRRRMLVYSAIILVVIGFLLQIAGWVGNYIANGT